MHMVRHQHEGVQKELVSLSVISEDLDEELLHASRLEDTSTTVRWRGDEQRALDTGLKPDILQEARITRLNAGCSPGIATDSGVISGVTEVGVSAPEKCPC
jgi:hypothetical protein